MNTKKTKEAGVTNSGLFECFSSPNVEDANGEPANVVDTLNRIGNCLNHVAHSIKADAMPGHDDAGGCVDSLTEAVMGTTKGLFAIASALDRIAQVMENKQEGL